MKRAIVIALALTCLLLFLNGLAYGVVVYLVHLGAMDIDKRYYLGVFVLHGAIYSIAPMTLASYSEVVRILRRPKLNVLELGLSGRHRIPNRPIKLRR
jgi:hypothetical protein